MKFDKLVSNIIEDNQSGPATAMNLNDPKYKPYMDAIKMKDANKARQIAYQMGFGQMHDFGYAVNNKDAKGASKIANQINPGVGTSFDTAVALKQGNTRQLNKISNQQGMNPDTFAFPMAMKNNDMNKANGIAKRNGYADANAMQTAINQQQQSK